ncbi:MAG: methyltransferase domain-containing protein [Gallionella sp.]|nr:methyltransferase domain-containing protein [Gallionella sp.]
MLRTSRAACSSASMPLYRKYQRGVPDYLARYYWWAYLWPRGIWLFDHQLVISAILFGQYNRLLNKTLRQVDTRPEARLLQLTCVYGKLTPSLLEASAGDVHLCDVAAGQIALARRKTQAVRCQLAMMNAESLAYAGDVFDQVIVFFLLHEMPTDARARTYSEIARVVRPGGSVLITEYAAEPRHHFLYRFGPFRRLLGILEPFLPGFWQEDLAVCLNTALGECGKELDGESHIEYAFAGFYRVMRFNVSRRIPGAI